MHPVVFGLYLPLLVAREAMCTSSTSVNVMNSDQMSTNLEEPCCSFYSNLYESVKTVYFVVKSRVSLALNLPGVGRYEKAF